MKTLDMRPKQSKLLSPGRFLNLTPEERARFARFEIVPARLGHSGFGKIRGIYKTPVYSTYGQRSAL